MKFDLKFNLGTLEIGSWVSVFLFGVVTSQAYFYYTHHFASDKRHIKIIVIVLWLAELAHTCSTAAGFYTISILLYNEPDQIFAKAGVGYVISTLMSGIIATLVQIYFGYQILRATGNRYVAYISWSLSCLRFLGSIGMVIIMVTRSLAEFQQTWIAAVTWAVGTVVDVLIAVTLMLFYFKKRREAIRNKQILDYLIAVTIQTGLLTSISTVSIAICFITMPDTLVWGAVGSALAKIFSISLLASLNARTLLRRMSATPSSLRIPTVMAMPQFSPNTPTSTFASPDTPADATVYYTTYETISPYPQQNYKPGHHQLDVEKQETEIFIQFPE